MRDVLTRRRVTVALAVLLGLLVVFYGGGGWYFAGQIRADALAGKAHPQADGPVPAGAEVVTYRCAGGDCPAWYVPGEGRTWAILLHGRGASRAEPLHGLAGAVRAHLPALDITYRNDAAAPRDPSGFYRYGATEWADLAGAVAYAREHGAAHAVLFGYSMGGAVVASYLRHVDAGDAGERGDTGDGAGDDFVRGVVLDAPMLDFGATVDFEASHRSLPLVGLPIPGSLVATAKAIAGARWDVDWDALDYVGSDWLHVPALVFHGGADQTVPPSTSKSFAAANGDAVHLVLTPGAGHVDSWQLDPAGYDRALDEFLAPLR